MKLKIITFTGIDEDTHLEHLYSLSSIRDNIEWGILYSPTKQGKDDRYPSEIFIKDFIQFAIENNMKFAVHMCGNAVSDILFNETIPVFENKYIRDSNSNIRIQLNRKFKKKEYDNIFEVLHWYRHLNFIILNNEINKNLCNEIQKMNYLTNTHFLYDESGGNGKETEMYPEAIKHYHGYSGGLGIHNIKGKIKTFEKISSSDYWIDMESNIRHDNKFSLKKVNDILNIVAELK